MAMTLSRTGRFGNTSPASGLTIGSIAPDTTSISTACRIPLLAMVRSACTGGNAPPGTLCAASQYATIGLPDLLRKPYARNGCASLCSAGMSGRAILMFASRCVSANKAFVFCSA